MLRSCGLGETQQVDLLCGALERIANQEVMVLEEERGTCAQIWRTLDELYGNKAPGVKLRVDFFVACQNRGGDDRNQGGVAQGEEILRDQLVFGLLPVPIRQELQQQVRRNPQLTFLEVIREAKILEREGDKARGEWDKAFAICRKVEREEVTDGKVEAAWLTRHQPIQISPQSEMVVWTQMIEHPARTEFCAFVEAIEEDAEWQVARTLAWGRINAEALGAAAQGLRF
ncbi:UNVERIFIED_CONTAM: hypothetical protein FKN15_067284 [Acipenser sinensis]